MGARGLTPGKKKLPLLEVLLVLIRMSVPRFIIIIIIIIIIVIIIIMIVSNCCFTYLLWVMYLLAPLVRSGQSEDGGDDDVPFNP